MDAGVPLSGQRRVSPWASFWKVRALAVLSDILGDEDHLGDMDLRSPAPDQGINVAADGHQDRGITEEIMKSRARPGQGRAASTSSAKMSKALDRCAAAELGEYAPRIETFKIATGQDPRSIGTGGKVIREIVEKKTAPRSIIDDDGTVKVASADGESIKAAIKWINRSPPIRSSADVYGTVVKVTGVRRVRELLPSYPAPSRELLSSPSSLPPSTPPPPPPHPPSPPPPPLPLLPLSGGAKDGLVQLSPLATNRVQKTSDVVKERRQGQGQAARLRRSRQDALWGGDEGRSTSDRRGPRGPSRKPRLALAKPPANNS